MGLLLGGSVITVLELLDLVVYNTVIKMGNAHKDRRVSPSQVKLTEAPESNVSTISKNTDPVITDHRPPSYHTIDPGKTNFQAQYSS